MGVLRHITASQLQAELGFGLGKSEVLIQGHEKDYMCTCAACGLFPEVMAMQYGHGKEVFAEGNEE